MPAGSPPSPDFLPTLPEIGRYFTGAWRLMAGDRRGLDRLDLSADGFWRSFAALVVALPPTALSWLEFERVERAQAAASPVRALAAHALADLTAWLLPLLLVAMAARHIDFQKRIVPFVVAVNWGGALLTWAFSPFFLLLLLGGQSGLTQGLGLVIALASIVLTVRLIAVATACDYALSIAIVTMMVFVSLLSFAAVSDLFGLVIG
ncbi:hypothetical protein D3218_03520 [Aureimonas flava]|uniref:Transporter n=1 Tax=Aureimonas flava TaxID=2320271 RepID=A0A3A1WNY8_9HYPH|nr:hypothetical protein [Aureimonas flava]RIY02455.1 hypothetical protein D3218_03520 [Aureimonas flava]